MGVKDDVTLRSSIRLSPVRMGMFALVPVLLAIAQLLNSVLTGLPLTVSVPFAVLMVAYAVLYTRYHVAELRLQEIERETLAASSD